MIKVNSRGVFMSLGGAMIKVNSPLLREILEEAIEEGLQIGWRRATEAAFITVLVARFGAKAKTVKTELKGVSDDRLEAILTLAATCTDLAAFRKELAPRRGKRRP